MGRKAELKALEGYLDAAVAGQGKLVFILGEAGLGKSTLVEHFRRIALRRYPRLRYAYAQCAQGPGNW